MSAAALDQLSGLSSAKRALRGLAAGGSSHAVLLYGAEGSGKSTLARWITQAWLCQSPSEDGGCGECKPCQAFARGASADVLEVAPRGKSDWIRLGQVTSDPQWPKEDQPPPLPLQEFARTAPLAASKKVIWVRDAHRMNNDATHALLKTLEEPPDYARFVLTTEEVRRVKDTILSRCLCLACEMPDGPDLAALLGPLEPWEAALGGESPGVAKRLRKSADVYRPIYVFAQGLSSLPQGAALKASEEFRALCEKLTEREDVGARKGNTEALKALATALSNLRWRPERVLAAVEAHRRVQGNAAMNLACDALFVHLLSPGPRT